MIVAAVLATLTHWTVPPMSDVPRLPDAEPTDGTKGGVVRIVAAQDEYEPGSFVVCSDEDIGKVQLSLGKFESEAGDTFPAQNLDLKVVKVWYQNLNGWYSYFADDGKKLCPELLLNDEELVRVDAEKVANYARVRAEDGSVTERWISAPKEMDKRYFEAYWRDTRSFFPMKKGFGDAATLQPVALGKGVHKQFFLTAHVTKDVKPGLYRGEVKLRGEGGQWRVPVALRVLPFVLPQPKTYRFPEKDFLVCSYSYLSHPFIMEENGGDRQLAARQFLAILKNQVAHNQTMHMPRADPENPKEVEEALAIMRAAGMRMNPLILPGAEGNEKGKALERKARNLRAYYDRLVGPGTEIFLTYGDEPGPWRFNQWRETFKAYQRHGFRFFIASQQACFHKAAPFYGWHNTNCPPEDPTLPDLWNQTGDTYSTWYSTHHVGSENPAFNRRQYGLAPWLSGFTAHCNYAHHLGPWNDDTTMYKPMVFAYGAYDGVVDTLAWEGFREGVDDIRYATLLCRLAREAQASKDPARHNLGTKALVFLADFDRFGDDLDAARMEMVDMIMEMRK